MPAAPEVAGTLFPGEQWPLVERYAELLATEGVTRGLIGPREAPKLWERHLLNCAVLAEVIPPAARVCDIGTGAGLPGLVVALARPDVRVTLVEPLLRRTRFLTEVVSELGLERVEVVRARAEELHGQRSFDLVTSRAVAPLRRLLRWSMPLVAAEGALVAMKGSSVIDEIAELGPDIHRWGLGSPEVLSVGQDVLASPATVVRVVWVDPGRVGLPLGSGRSSGSSTRAGKPSGRGGRPARRGRR